MTVIDQIQSNYSGETLRTEGKKTKQKKHDERIRLRNINTVNGAKSKETRAIKAPVTLVFPLISWESGAILVKENAKLLPTENCFKY